MGRKANKTARVKKQEALLKAYCECGVITKALEMVGIGRTTHYDWLREDPEYAAKYEDSEEELVKNLEAALDARAVEGVDEPIFHNGVQCGTKKRYSDTAAIFRLKALRPQKYREHTSVDFTGQMNVEHNGSIRILEDENWFGNSDRLLAQTNGSPSPDSTEPQEVQNNGQRPPLGQNGNGHHSGS